MHHFLFNFILKVKCTNFFIINILINNIDKSVIIYIFIKIKY